MSERRCPECYLPRPVSSFLSEADGAMCAICRSRLRLPRQLRSRKEWRSLTPKNEPLRVRLSMVSTNRKTGPIPVSTSSPSTCPKSCGWYGQGCYAEYHVMGHRWRNTAEDGMTWDAFCARIAALQPGTLWRHNEAGDLPGHGEDVDPLLLRQLIEANRGKRGFTYTHKKTPHALALVRFACSEGFTINVSCDTLAEVDALKARVTVPLVVTVPSDEKRTTWVTKGGTRVTVCPAQTQEDVTCQSCRLCAVGNRKTVVAFRAHGQSAASMNDRLVQVGLPF